MIHRCRTIYSPGPVRQSPVPEKPPAHGSVAGSGVCSRVWVSGIHLINIRGMRGVAEDTRLSTTVLEVRVAEEREIVLPSGNVRCGILRRKRQCQHPYDDHNPS